VRLGVVQGPVGDGDVTAEVPAPHLLGRYPIKGQHGLERLQGLGGELGAPGRTRLS
jgi:hypothetical protein